MQIHISDVQILKKYNIYRNCLLFLLKIKNQVTYENENITLQVKSLTNKFTKITLNGNIQTYMKELSSMKYKRNKILSSMLVVGLPLTIYPCGSILKDV